VSKCIQRSSLSDQVYKILKEQILSGKLKDGMKVVEEALAEEFEVSRTPIREAIRRLAEYGLITIKPRSHAIVTGITPTEADDIATVRITLEQLAINSIDSTSYVKYIEKIARHAADCQYALDIGDRARVFEEDSLFHMALVEASGNKALIFIYERLDAKIQMLRINQNLPEDELGHYIGQHIQIMNLLKKGDKKNCNALLHDHIKHDKSYSTELK